MVSFSFKLKLPFKLSRLPEVCTEAEFCLMLTNGGWESQANI
jgi:hypothetical protein